MLKKRALIFILFFLFQNEKASTDTQKYVNYFGYLGLFVLGACAIFKTKQQNKNIRELKDIVKNIKDIEEKITNTNNMLNTAKESLIKQIES
jgi:hypothetical protein